MSTLYLDLMGIFVTDLYHSTKGAPFGRFVAVLADRAFRADRARRVSAANEFVVFGCRCYDPCRISRKGEQLTGEEEKAVNDKGLNAGYAKRSLTFW